MISRIIFYLLTFIVVVAAGITLYGVVHFKWMYHSAANPKAEFLVSGNTNSENSFILFTAYPCGYCKDLDAVVRELREVRKDWRFVIRPIAFGTEGAMYSLTSTAFAMGEEGGFEDMHQALMEYPELEVPEDFIYETASLYGVDKDRLNELKESKKIKKYIENNNAALEHIGVNSVPSFMIGKDVHVINSETLPTLKDLLNIIEQYER